MSVTREQFDQLSATVATLAENMEAVTNSKASVDTSEIAEAIANAIKPLREELAEMKSAKANAEKAELDGYVDQIVKANLLDEESAKELTLNAAKSLAAKCKPASAAAISRGFATNADDEFAGYDLNAHLEVN